MSFNGIETRAPGSTQERVINLKLSDGALLFTEALKCDPSVLHFPALFCPLNNDLMDKGRERSDPDTRYSEKKMYVGTR